MNNKISDMFGKITIGDKEYLLIEEAVLESMLKGNTLNRDELMNKFKQYDQCVFMYCDGEDDEGNKYTTDDLNHAREEYINAICSLSLPTLSEEEIDKAVTDYIDEQFVGLDPLVWADEIKFAKSHFLHGFKACQQLTKPKKKEK